MAIEIVVPRLGWSMDEGTFAEWLKQEGEWVNAGDMIFVLEGEKATQEIESFDSGVLRIPPDAPQPGDTVSVGQLLAYLVARDEPAPFEAGETVSVKAHEQSASGNNLSRVAGPAIRRLARDLGVDMNSVVGSGPGGRVTQDDVQAAAAAATSSDNGDGRGRSRRAGRVAVTPRARRLARELGVDCSKLVGSGRNGRVRERDVQSAATQGGVVRTAGLAGKTIPITHIRRTIAERMLAGVHEAAPVTLTTKVDATNLVNLRHQLKAADSPGACPTYTDVLIKLTSSALAEHPLLNAHWTDEGIVVSEVVNIAFAVNTEAGLLAPVVADVGRLSLRDVAATTDSLASAARSRQLTADQLSGGTFTISNLGAYGIDSFTPIVNLPQAAILGVGRIVREPVVVDDDRIVPRDMLTLSLTFDHRVVDGAPAAQFLATLRHRVEQPAAWLLS